MLQRTLKNQITIQGIGVHSGRPASVTLKPALPNQGIHFIRTDLAQASPIPASYQNVVDTRMATTLGKDGVTVSTVEHLLAAVYGCGVDNLTVEVDGPEIPILDGSSIGFCDAIYSAGVESQLQPRNFIVLRKRIEVKVAEKWAVAEPANQLTIHSTVEWDHPAIGYQEFKFREGKTEFSELASARTFGFLRDIEKLREMGLARGGSLDNAIVLDDFRILNPNGLRCPDEFVKHKVLDAMGDFILSGFRIQAAIRLHRSGHDLHSMLVKAILKDASNYELVSSAGTTAGLEDQRKVARLQAALARAGRVAATY